MFAKNRVPGDAYDVPKPAKVRVPVLHVPRGLYLAWLALKLVWKLIVVGYRSAVVLARYAYLSAPVLTLLILWVWFGWQITAGVVVMAAAGLVVWWWQHPGSFWSRVGWFYEAQWRWWRIYRKHWAPTCAGIGLGQAFAGTKYFPAIVKARRDRFGDLLTVRLLPGQTPDDWAQVAYRFAYTYGALSSKMIHSDAGGDVTLRLFHREVLTDLVAPLPIPAFPNLHRLPVAVRADGSILSVSVPGHVLIVGATGSGKAGVQWALLSAMAADIHSGLIRVYGFDPKGGMELVIGRRLMHRLFYGDVEELAGHLADIVKIMKRRTETLRGREAREYTPTVDEPTIIVLIDELATLTAYVSDPKLKAQIKDSLSLLLSQGRAPGVFVIASTQDPRKEVIPVRNHFATRIALRLNEKADVEMVLSDDAVDRGAACHLIPRGLPGVGYVLEEGNPQPTRVRFPHLTDDAVKELAATCQAPTFGGIGEQ